MPSKKTSAGVVAIVGATFVGLVTAVSPTSGGSSPTLITTSPALVASTTSPTPVGQSFELGINVAPSVYYSGERTFANLAQASAVWRDPNNGWTDIPAAGLTSAGYPLVNGQLSLNAPQTVRSGIATKVTCTWTGSGRIRIDGDTGSVWAPAGAHALTFSWPSSSNPSLNFFIDSILTTDPFGNLDCREPGLVSNGAFDQRIVDDLKPYAVLRFLDWSTANANPASVTWATRSTPEKVVQNGSDGMALEHMIDLANAAGSDAWFTVPWNADQNYVQQMAALVRDRLAPNHKAYFELSNETWNYGFPVATQALNEGVAENLSTDRYTNNQLRYAEKSTV